MGRKRVRELSPDDVVIIGSVDLGQDIEVRGNLGVRHLANGPGKQPDGVVQNPTHVFWRGDGQWAEFPGVSPPGASTALCIIGNGVDDIVPGVAGDISVDFDYEISRWTLVETFPLDTDVDLVLDLWDHAYGSVVPTAADSICASAKPTLSAAKEARSTVLTGWTTSIAEGRILRVHVDVASGVQQATLALQLQRV